MLSGASVTRRAIRFYEQLGLLPPAGRDYRGQRVYVHSDLLRLRLIRELREAGLSLSSIRDLLDSRVVHPDEEQGLWIDRLLSVLARQAEDLGQQVQAVTRAEREIREALIFIRGHRGTLQKRPDQVLNDPSTPLIVTALISQPADLSTTSPRTDKLPPMHPPGLKGLVARTG